MHFQSEELVTGIDIMEYFRESVSAAISNQKLDASETAAFYLVNLLTSFSRTEDFFEQTEEGLMLRPLALIYADALNAETERERNRNLQKLGDVALFIAGFFSSYLNSKPVDLDYYIAMGGNAYSMLAIKISYLRNHDQIRQTFNELSEKFVGFVNVLSEIGEKYKINNNTDLMRLYELWLHTGNKNAEKELRRNGIYPVNMGIEIH